MSDVCVYVVLNVDQLLGVFSSRGKADTYVAEREKCGLSTSDVKEVIVDELQEVFAQYVGDELYLC